MNISKLVEKAKRGIIELLKLRYLNKKVRLWLPDFFILSFIKKCFPVDSMWWFFKPVFVDHDICAIFCEFSYIDNELTIHHPKVSSTVC